MQSTQGNERVPTSKFDGISIPKVSSLNEHPQIQHTRKRLNILLRICLGFVILTFFVTFARLTIDIRKSSHVQYGYIGSGAIHIILYVFALLATHRYSRRGLQVFAWIEIILTVFSIITLAMFVYTVIILITTSSSPESDLIREAYGPGLSSSSIVVILIFLIVVLIFDLIIRIMLIKCSFQLARLIKANQD